MRFLLPTLGLIVLISVHSSAQCSDAGVCSIGHGASDPEHSLSISYTFGSSGTPDDLRFHSVDLSVSLRLLSSSTIVVRVPYNRQSGPLGSASGLGDLMVFWDQEIVNEMGMSLSLSAGGKFATGSVTRGTLPQRYQNGLGTNDVLLGATLRISPWSFSAGYQIAGGRSKNPVNRLERGDDLLLRVGYGVELTSVSVGGELLFLQRLGTSSLLISPPSQPETFGELAGSAQTQVNLLGRVETPLSDDVSVGALVAIPLLQRSVNVDGLKRMFSFSAGLSYSF